ncbi:uncharacterized protein LY89DRAFT_759284 [Mollisia scopiformis]|uniref:Uncharacterized protein n=1 Tax=Mollisia scopiformis TaxID=149040 RepID=A0A194WTR2_MOLSC|nr:uncharacterized protein LY89DRAFT_759284 [Mollisia scopiformis]KUJ11348.1 hypothetical protein LY89DRAFT_759284 [Mollisia scopiformis]
MIRSLSTYTFHSNYSNISQSAAEVSTSKMTNILSNFEGSDQDQNIGIEKVDQTLITRVEAWLNSISEGAPDTTSSTATESQQKEFSNTLSEDDTHQFDFKPYSSVPSIDIWDWVKQPPSPEKWCESVGDADDESSLDDADSTPESDWETSSLVGSCKESASDGDSRSKYPENCEMKLPLTKRLRSPNNT